MRTSENFLGPDRKHSQESSQYLGTGATAKIPRLQLSRVNEMAKTTTVDFTGRESLKPASVETEFTKTNNNRFFKRPKPGHQSGKSEVVLSESRFGIRNPNKSSLPTLGESSLKPIMLVPTNDGSPETSLTWEQKIKLKRHQQKLDNARLRRTDQMSNYRSFTDRDKPAERTTSTGFAEPESSRLNPGAAYDVLDMANSELRKKGGGTWDRKQVAKAFQLEGSQPEWLLYHGKLQQRDSVWATRKSKLSRRSQLSIDEGARSASRTELRIDPTGEASTLGKQPAHQAARSSAREEVVEHVSRVYKLDIDAGYWLGEAQFAKLVGMLKNPLALQSDNSAAGIKKGAQMADEAWSSIMQLLKLLKSYLSKFLAESFSEEDVRPHRSIQDMILDELQNRATELKAFTEGRMKLVFVQEEQSLPKAKVAASLETTSDFRKIVKELIGWFKFAREKFGVELENPDILPREHPNAEKLNFEMEKVKSLLFVKNQNELMENVDRLEKVLNRVTNCAITLAHEADQLRRHNEMLEGVVYKLREEIKSKVAALQETYDKIEVVKPPDRLKIMLDIEEELSLLKKTHSEEMKELTQRIDSLEFETKTKQITITELEYKLTNRNVQEHKAVQVTLDTEEKPKENLNEMKSYFENINYFILGGKLQSVEWVTLLITDIFNSKLQADNIDLKAKRDVTTLKTFTFQYFMKQFGCRRVGFAFLKDFFYSLSQLYQENIRFESFLNLCGCNSLRLRQNMDMQEYLRKNKVTSILTSGPLHDLHPSLSNQPLHSDRLQHPAHPGIRKRLLHAEPQHKPERSATSRRGTDFVRNTPQKVQTARRLPVQRTR